MFNRLNAFPKIFVRFLHRSPGEAPLPGGLPPPGNPFDPSKLFKEMLEEGDDVWTQKYRDFALSDEVWDKKHPEHYHKFPFLKLTRESYDPAAELAVQSVVEVLGTLTEKVLPSGISGEHYYDTWTLFQYWKSVKEWAQGSFF